MSDLSITPELPPTPEHIVSVLTSCQAMLLECPQVKVATEHVIHGGMYARTVRLEPGTVIIGALVKVPTTLIVHGHTRVLVGDEAVELTGYNVIPASAGRKQAFRAISKVEITAIFATQAKSVEEAEKEFTGEWHLLVTQNGGESLVTITGE